MEIRYYIIFTVAFILLQLFLYSFGRTLNWLFNLSTNWRKNITIFSYLATNSLFILHFMGIIRIFRPMALILALLLFVFLLSLATLIINHITHKKANNWLRIIYPFAYFGLIGMSIYNAYTPTVIYQKIEINKPLDKPLKIGLASDFHLGTYFGAKQLDELAEIFNREKVDLILLPGDIMDDNVIAYRNEKMQPHLAKLQAPLGVYATFGNHDLFGSQQQIAEEIQKVGIHLLLDQAVEINEKFTIIGRNDSTYRIRPSTAELLQNVNTQKPVFLLDHQPNEITLHEKLPIDLQVSGHVHKGQVFPANFITQMMYPLHYGYQKRGLGHYVVTSGYGFWGIPLRLGSQSEVWIIEVTGK